ncbi:unnamed protein product, partial [Laminaria digitata]
RGWGTHVSVPVGWKPKGKGTGKAIGGSWMSAGGGNRRRNQGSPSSSGNTNGVPQGSNNSEAWGLETTPIPPQPRAGEEGWAEKEEMGLQEA